MKVSARESPRPSPVPRGRRPEKGRPKRCSEHAQWAKQGLAQETRRTPGEHVPRKTSCGEPAARRQTTEAERLWAELRPPKLPCQGPDTQYLGA